MSETAVPASGTSEARSAVVPIAASASEVERSWGVATLLVAGIGGIATGLALAAMLTWSSIPEAFAIEPVATADVDAAAASLFGPAMVATVEAAKSCRRPLAFVTVEATGETLGTLRFASGGYVSPNIKLGRKPFRLALPFPAPVEAGAGQLVVSSDTDGAAVFLRPGVVIPPGARETTLHVTWNPKTSCHADQ